VIAVGVVEAIEQWPKKVRARCQELLDECVADSYQPNWNRKKFGDHKQCAACNIACLNDGGKWPIDKCPRPGQLPPN